MKPNFEEVLIDFLFFWFFPPKLKTISTALAPIIINNIVKNDIIFRPYLKY